MARLFGVPIEHLALAAAIACALIVAAVLAVVLRRRVLWRLGLRNIPRRPGSSLLVVAGLTLGTAVVASALFTGDTMTHTLRSLVAARPTPPRGRAVAGTRRGRGEGVGPQTRARPGGQTRRWFEALATGAPLTAGSGYFDTTLADRLAAVPGGGKTVAALVPAIVEQGTLVDLTTQQLLTNTNVLAHAPEVPPGLGALD